MRVLYCCLCVISVDVLFAQDDSTPAVRGVERIQISTGGVGVYRPETWGLIKLGLRNPQDREASLLAVTHFKGNPTLQFGRRFWMPPHSRMTTWHPIPMPVVTDPQTDFFDLQTQVLSTDTGTETLAMSDVGALQFEQSFFVASNEPVTAVILPPGVGESQNKLWASPLDLLMTARYERGLSSNLAFYAEHLAPAGAETLAVLDHLVLAHDRVVTDAAGIGAIRRWVASGGRLWVMADQVSPELLEALLGDDNALTVVDRVEITYLNLVSTTGTAPTEFIRELDRPVPLVRVVADGVEPAFLVDGWPAAFWKPYGRGRVLVTTLGADGWVRERHHSDTTPGLGANMTDFFPSEPLSTLAAHFFVRRAAPALSPAVAEEQVRAMIGYSIPGRGLVLGTLLGFTTLLALGGIWFSKRGRLEFIGLMAPVVAMLAGGLLLMTGQWKRAEISDASVAIQLVQAVPGTADIHTVGVAGVFSKGEAETAPLAGVMGGWGLPEMSGLEGTVRRMVWTDLDRWSWEKLPQRPGLRTVGMQAAGPSPKPLLAFAGFQNGQLSGTVQLPDGLHPADAILATASGRIGLQIQNNGDWTALEELGSDQYLSATVLTDEQQRRTLILSEILKRNPSQPVPPIPTMYLWTQPWEAGQSFGPQSLTGSALVSVPVNWQLPQAGTEFTIPRSLLTFKEVVGPDGTKPSGFFDSRSGQWVERTRSTSGWVAFNVPPALLPLRTIRVEVLLKASGPMEHLELFGFRAGQRVSLRVWENPVGTLRHTIEDGTLIPIDGSGRFQFGLDAGIDHEISTTDESSLTESKGEQSPVQSEENAVDQPDEKHNPATYWQFDDISARITVEVP